MLRCQRGKAIVHVNPKFGKTKGMGQHHRAGVELKEIEYLAFESWGEPQRGSIPLIAACSERWKTTDVDVLSFRSGFAKVHFWCFKLQKSGVLEGGAAGIGHVCSVSGG